MKILATIEGFPITINDDGSISFSANGRIDGDGSGSSHGDPDFQADTSLHHANGQALNADLESYCVVPPQIIMGVPGIVLGCKGQITYQGTTISAVVGDIGPHSKLGEMSIAAAAALGIPSSPTTGGIEGQGPGVHYQLWPGVAADGYNLQASN